MSLKKRIVLWYAIWTLVLMAIVFAIFFLFSSSISLRNLRHDVEEALSDSAEDLLSGRRDIDEFDDGIYTFIYNIDGELLFGRNIERINNIPYREGQRIFTFSDSTWVLSDMMLDSYYIRSASEHSNFYTLLASDYLPLAIAAPILAIISALGGALIVRRSFKPFDKLIETASSIASGDDLDERLPSGKTEEERELSLAFNSMLSRLDDSFKRQKEFTDDASHELRTPIAIIKAESEYALSLIDDTKETEEALNVIKREVDRMTRLIDSLLLLSRADNNRLALDKKDFSLSFLAETVVESLEEKAKEKGLTLRSEIEEGIKVHADEDQITRALINLIDNAIAYSKENGSINVTLKKTDFISLAVMDDGIGIDKSEQEKIFERFYQVDKARSGSSSGLGLSMVKEIARLNDVKIEVESEKGKGSTFTLIFHRL